MKKLLEVIKQARFVWICGNGGSAATAEHFTADLFKKGIKAICLNSNTAIMTMIANDFGYHFTFSKQLEVYATKDDLFITISCSGTSVNVMTAISRARMIGMKIFSFETFEEDRDYEKLEDKHLKFAHEVKKAL